MTGLGDGEAEHGENAAADHAADADGGDFGKAELAAACVVHARATVQPNRLPNHVAAMHNQSRASTMSQTNKRDKPWIFRTYAGHSSAADSNALYRYNLAKGQTGLSVAFDLPTQTGYDSRPRARAGRSRQGRRAGLPSRRHARAVRRHPARHHEHLDDHQRHRGVADGALYRGGRRAGRAAPRSQAPPRTTSSRNICRAAPMCFRRRRRCG